MGRKKDEEKTKIENEGNKEKKDERRGQQYLD